MRALEVVELVDRHHVDGAHRSILARRVPPSRPASSAGRLCVVLGSAAALLRPKQRRILFDLGGVGRSSTGLGLASNPSRSSASTSAPLVERRLHGLDARGAEM
jgi:hypothetical protein